MGIKGEFEYLRTMIGYIVLAFFLYFLYRFIVGFVVPVVRTANQMKRKVNEMNQPFGQNGAHEQRAQRPQSPQVNISGNRKGPFSRFTARKAAEGAQGKPSKADYIDFEEI